MRDVFGEDDVRAGAPVHVTRFLDGAADRVGSGAASPSDFVLFRGASVWSPGQLEREMAEGVWVAVETRDAWAAVRTHAERVAAASSSSSSSSSSGGGRGRMRGGGRRWPWQDGGKGTGSKGIDGDAMWEGLLQSLGGEHALMASAVPKGRGSS
jgi:hypothetical protein